jgi:hypothetical protein
MTPNEIAEACGALEKKVGPHSAVYVTIRSHGLSSSLYTKGICADAGDVAAFTVASQERDPAKNLADLEAQWLAKRAARNGRLIEKMALEIIRLTTECGQCTDAALRAEFGPLVSELSEQAVALANDMADRGPFEVVVLQQANAA